MDFQKIFVTNKEKEQKGVWKKGPEDSEFLIARAGNKSFMKLAGQLIKPYRSLMKIGKADDDVINEISAEVTSRTVLLDWKNFKDGDVEVPYSQAEAKRRILASSDFAEFISGLAQDVSSFQDEEQEAATKNS